MLCQLEDKDPLEDDLLADIRASKEASNEDAVANEEGPPGAENGDQPLQNNNADGIAQGGNEEEDHNIISPPRQQRQVVQDLGTPNLPPIYVDHHRLEKPPHYSGKYIEGSGWDQVKTKYLQRKCCECSKRTRRYCVCNPFRFMCNACFTLHKTEYLAEEQEDSDA